jgi:hypothetical protein
MKSRKQASRATKRTDSKLKTQPNDASVDAFLGNHKTGKGCLYIRDLEEIDKPTLASLIKESIARLARTFGKSRE